MADIDTTKLRRLDFALLLVFREIIRHGKASVAAERLGLSQPAVSHALARLRDLTGDPVRQSRCLGTGAEGRGPCAVKVEYPLHIGTNCNHRYL